jgi:membrane associated rhomboid family serine protease
VIPLKDENPTATFPIVTILFIVINISLFAYELSLGGTDIQPFVKRMAVVPHEILHGFAIREYPTLVTSMFLHGGLLHLLFNMLFLWIFGNNIEDALGHISFVIFYLLCGIAASFAHAFFNAASDTPVIGASGAISGILGAYLILYPRARVQVALFFIRVVRVPAWFFLIVWIAFQLIQGLPSLGADAGRAGGVAWLAHIGGFVAGIVLLPLFLRRRQARRLEEI